MNEELQGTLNSALVELIEAATTAKDFIVAEIPDVVQQLLLWKVVICGTWAVLLALISAGCFITMVVGIKDDWDAEYPACWFFFGVVTLLGAAASGTTWLQILIAPKLYLIEYAASLVK